MMNFEDEDQRADIKVIETNGSKIFLKRTDPYGFWHIEFEKGVKPESLEGSFTELDRAENVVKEYLANHKIRELKAA